MQVRISKELKKPLKIFAAENDLSVPQAVERLLTSSNALLRSTGNRKRK